MFEAAKEFLALVTSSDIDTIVIALVAFIGFGVAFLLGVLMYHLIREAIARPKKQMELDLTIAEKALSEINQELRTTKREYESAILKATETEMKNEDLQDRLRRAGAHIVSLEESIIELNIKFKSMQKAVAMNLGRRQSTGIEEIDNMFSLDSAPYNGEGRRITDHGIMPAKHAKIIDTTPYSNVSESINEIRSVVDPEHHLIDVVLDDEEGEKDGD